MNGGFEIGKYAHEMMCSWEIYPDGGWKLGNKSMKDTEGLYIARTF